MKEKISNLEIGCLSTFLMKSFILINGINILLDINSNDSIISILISLFLEIFLINMISKKRFNIFDYVNNNFNIIISLIIKIVLVSCVFTFGSYLLYTTSIFIKSCYLSNMTILPISILFVTCSLYLSKNITTLSRSGFICFFIFLLIEIVSFLFLLKNINSLKILPLFKYSTEKTLISSFYFIILSFSPVFLLLSIPKEKIIERKKNKYIKVFNIITNIYLLFNFVLVLSIIDVKLAKIIDYPEVVVLSKISLLNFFERMEGILSFKFIFDLLFTIGLCIYYIKEGVKKTFNKKKAKYINIIFIFLFLITCNYFEINNNTLIISLLVFMIVNIVLYIYSLFNYQSVYSNNQKYK